MLKGQDWGRQLTDNSGQGDVGAQEGACQPRRS